MSSSKETLQRYIHENGVRRILARVQPNQPRFLVRECTLQNIDGEQSVVLKVALTSPPEEGKANHELVTELSALLAMTVTLQSGQQQRVKTLLVS